MFVYYSLYGLDQIRFDEYSTSLESFFIEFYSLLNGFEQFKKKQIRKLKRSHGIEGKINPYVQYPK